MFKDRLNEILSLRKPFFADRMNFISLGFAAVINLIHWSILYYNIKPGSSSILLHYNVVYGADLIEKSSYLYRIPLLALVLLVFNGILSNAYYKREKLASYFLNFGSLVVQIFFLIATIVIIVANA